MSKEREHIRTYFQDHMKAFEGNLIESAFLTEKAIHQLRVTIKRLRTLMKLLEDYTIYPESFHYQFKKITSIFRSLGAIRDNRNRAKLINYHFENDAALKEKLLFQLEEKLENIKSLYLEKFREYSFEYLYQFKTQFDYYLQYKLKDIDSRLAISDKTDDIAGLLDQDGLKEHLHKIRSNVKELLFLLQIFKFEKIKLNGYSIVTKDLASLGEYIGQWHDYELLINLYSSANEQLNGKPSIEYDSIIEKSNELFDYVSERLQSQFNLTYAYG